MIWREEDKREELNKKLEYARELDQQIELRRQIEEGEKQQAEEWERRFVAVSSDQSPAKWWSEVGGGEVNRFGFTMDSSALPPMNGAADDSLASGARSASHQRFRTAIDPLSTQDRLRHKAQQLEWRRLLDEQVREKERRLQEEAEEKRRREYEEAHEEMRFLRERQLRAQRKLGIVDTGVTSTAGFVPSNYVAIPSPPAPQTVQVVDTQHGNYELHPVWSPVKPPPAPTGYPRVNASVDYTFREAMGLVEHQPLQDSRLTIANEYRSLLSEIRREREELRREREELRREKEELRMERALMQMENEKMATLLESQRHMNEQRHETMNRLDRGDDLAIDTNAPAKSPLAMRLPSPLQPIIRGRTAAPHRAQESPVNRLGSRLGALSMADFAMPTTAVRSPANAVTSPRLRRLARFRQQEENPLERSLIGESEFVAVAPTRQRRQDGAPRITETNSPAASRFEARPNALRNSRVIKSRGFYDFNRPDAVPVVAVRQAEERGSSVATTRHSTRPSAWTKQEEYHERYYEEDALSDEDHASADDEHQHHDDDEEEEEELEEHEERSSSEPELSRSLFQVQVLVKE